jgi:hypothetical protein
MLIYFISLHIAAQQSSSAIAFKSGAQGSSGGSGSVTLKDSTSRDRNSKVRKTDSYVITMFKNDTIYGHYFGFDDKQWYI